MDLTLRRDYLAPCSYSLSPCPLLIRAGSVIHSCPQVDLIMQRDQLTASLAASEDRTRQVVDHVRTMYNALALDKTLKVG